MLGWVGEWSDCTISQSDVLGAALVVEVVGIAISYRS